MEPRRVSVCALGLKNDEIDELAADAVVWATQHGLVMGAKSGGTAPDLAGSGVQITTVHAPVSLSPVALPRREYERALALSGVISSLMDAVSRDRAYLRETLEVAAQEDPFTGDLLKLMNDIEAEVGPERMVDPVTLLMTRSDYMLDEPSTRMLQVEINMIAASFASLSTLVSRLHRYLALRHPGILAGDADANNLPENEPLAGFADAMGEAVRRYCAHKGWEAPRPGASSAPDAPIVLMVVQPGERNAFDQQWIASTLWERHGVRTVRKLFKEVAAEAQVGSDGTLTLGGRRVALAYLRAGYTPADFVTESDWQGRRVLEVSDAPKVPNLAQQLAGTKKVQQDLARPGVLERFLSDQDAGGLRAVFAGQWSFEEFDGAEARGVIAKALENPDAYVLKPQREGGGNNLYGEDAAKVLRAGGRKLGAYILMERIRPPVNKTLFLREGVWAEGDSLSEVGVYGAYVRVGSDAPAVNCAAGTLIRTKLESSNEGGVAAGFAVLDSPRLT
ncbi:unnamed protein product [Pedinophyceae sp. YPF-701]|nr:unnamed protein product [Pedinophyceae sp. YPF-701]